MDFQWMIARYVNDKSSKTTRKRISLAYPKSKRFASAFTVKSQALIFFFHQKPKRKRSQGDELTNFDFSGTTNNPFNVAC